MNTVICNVNIFTNFFTNKIFIIFPWDNFFLHETFHHENFPDENKVHIASQVSLIYAPLTTEKCSLIGRFW